jgi:hypothetical protein
MGEGSQETIRGNVTCGSGEAQPRLRRINREWTRMNANKSQLFVSIRVHSRFDLEFRVPRGPGKRNHVPNIGYAC